jgi:hypothetical protein
MFMDVMCPPKVPYEVSLSALHLKKKCLVMDDHMDRKKSAQPQKCETVSWGFAFLRG